MSEKITLICYPTNQMITNVLTKLLPQDRHNIDYWDILPNYVTNFKNKSCMITHSKNME